MSVCGPSLKGIPVGTTLCGQSHRYYHHRAPCHPQKNPHHHPRPRCHPGHRDHTPCHPQKYPPHHSGHPGHPGHPGHHPQKIFIIILVIQVVLGALCQHYVLEKSATHAEHCQHRDPFDRSIDLVSIIIVIITTIIVYIIICVKVVYDLNTSSRPTSAK